MTEKQAFQEYVKALTNGEVSILSSLLAVFVLSQMHIVEGGRVFAALYLLLLLTAVGLHTATGNKAGHYYYNSIAILLPLEAALFIFSLRYVLWAGLVAAALVICIRSVLRFMRASPFVMTAAWCTGLVVLLPAMHFFYTDVRMITFIAA